MAAGVLVEPLSMALGALGGLLPDIIDVPLHTLFGISILHRESWHSTVPRRHAVFGLLTQAFTILAAGRGISNHRRATDDAHDAA